MLYGYIGFKVPKADQPWDEDAVTAAATATATPQQHVEPDPIPTEKETP
jgi:hypothetical protein